MSELHPKAGESARDWLTRLRQVDPTSLPGHARKALALSIGRAEYLARRAAPGGRAPDRRC